MNCGLGFVRSCRPASAIERDPISEKHKRKMQQCIDIELCKMHRLMLYVQHDSVGMHAHMYAQSICTFYNYEQHTCPRASVFKCNQISGYRTFTVTSIHCQHLVESPALYLMFPILSYLDRVEQGSSIKMLPRNDSLPQGGLSLLEKGTIPVVFSSPSLSTLQVTLTSMFSSPKKPIVWPCLKVIELEVLARSAPLGCISRQGWKSTKVPGMVAQRR